MPNEPQPGAASHRNERRVLVLPTTAADGAAIGKLFRANGIEFDLCAHMRELCEAYTVGAGTLIVAEEALLADCDELLSCIAEQPVWSDLPIIALSRSGRETAALAGIIARLGNVSVVERPIRTSTFVTLARSNLRARERQYQVREYLLQLEHAQIERERLLGSERAARAEAERAGRTKDEFLATLSHELRTPLNAILGWTQVLRTTPDLPADAVTALAVIERNARSQAQIIADLLDMSSIISGKVRLDLEQLDLASVVNATVETVLPAALAKNIRVQVVLDPMAGPVRADPNRLQQVLWNLLTNALKFTAKNGRVSVTLARVDSHLEIAVADNGEGIDPAFLPYVFDRFRQADASATRHHGGLGLGLSIVKQLVEMHGGSISAQSPGMGAGATFRVALPLMEAGDGSTDRDPSGAQPTRSINVPMVDEIRTVSLQGLKVLVVDDEPDARSLIQRLLQDNHARVVTAASAAEAMQALAREAPDVIVSDIGMPGEDGYALIRRIRALRSAGANIPAIALTAYARVEDRSKAADAGFQSHLSKPVRAAELLATVESLARRSP